MDDLSKIYDIRNRKLTRLKKVERSRQNGVDTARNDLAQAKQDMRAFADEIKNLEQDMLKGLLGNEIDTSDILMINRILEKSKNNAQKLVERHHEAEEALNSKISALETSRSDRIMMDGKLNRIREVNVEYDKKEAAANKTKAEAAEDKIAEAVFNVGRSE